MKIFISTPYASDANSFWRCMGPMSYLAKHSSDISIYCAPLGTPFQWDTLTQYDVVFMHRPCRPEDVKLIQMSRALNIPVWCDYDDWLFHLPDWNKAQAIYHNETVQHVMGTCIATADVVTVSTTLLQKEFSKLNKNVILLPNAYREDLFPFRTDNPPERKDIYYWRGSNTHDGDLSFVLDGITSLQSPIHFFGEPPHFLISKMNKDLVVKKGFVDTIRYWKSIYDLAGKVMIFPLDSDYFNQCKSNIAWMEAIHAGSLIVAPGMPEWEHLGAVTYTPNNPNSFYAACEAAMSMTSEEVKERNQDAFHYMKNKYGIKTVNQIRESIVRSITSPTFERNTQDLFNSIVGLWALNILKQKDTAEKAS